MKKKLKYRHFAIFNRNLEQFGCTRSVNLLQARKDSEEPSTVIRLMRVRDCKVCVAYNGLKWKGCF